MRLRRKLLKLATEQAYKQFSTFFSHTDPERLERLSEHRAIRTFRNAYRNSLGYREFMDRQGISPKLIQDIGGFKRHVPLIDKETVFERSQFRDWCRGGTVDKIDVFWSSSGHSQSFSFGGDSQRGIGDAAFAIEFLLEEVFDALKKKTLVLNALPMGVMVPSRLIAQAQTSVRADIVAGLVRKLHNDFEQFIIIGDPIFLKHAIEYGVENGQVWNNATVHLVAGGEFVPETWRSYLANLLGIDFQQPDTGSIATTMGLSELGLGIFNETRETIALRRKALVNDEIREAIVGHKSCLCPEIMLFSPLSYFCETKPHQDGYEELIVTPLYKKAPVPLVRYNTADQVRLLKHGEYSRILKKFGLLELIPKWKFPVGVILGKGYPSARLNPLIVKQILFEDFNIVENLTGVFHLKKETVYLQQRKGREISSGQKKDLKEALEHQAQKKISLELFPFCSYPFHMNIDFERKNQHEIL